MELDLYQVDAFTNQTFSGNPAAVCPLETWLPDETMRNIAMENNLSETAFFVPETEQNTYHLRWFTPVDEVKLCGHATLATAHTIFEYLTPDAKAITFNTLSGPLIITKSGNGLVMDFPLWDYTPRDTPAIVTESLGAQPIAYFAGHDDIAVFENEETIRNLKPNMSRLAEFEETRGVLATAPGSSDDTDFVSRAFFPRLGVPEDPVTGSAHCLLAPYWAEKLGKTTLKARQISARGGDLLCEIKDDRLFITGEATLYMKGTIFV